MFRYVSYYRISIGGTGLVRRGAWICPIFGRSCGARDWCESFVPDFHPDHLPLRCGLDPMSRCEFLFQSDSIDSKRQIRAIGACVRLGVSRRRRMINITEVTTSHNDQPDSILIFDG